MQTLETKKKASTEISSRKRPNKAVIEMTALLRGYMTGNEKLQLATLTVKNAMQRVNNRAMSENTEDNFKGAEVDQLQKLIKDFVKNVDEVLKTK